MRKFNVIRILAFLLLALPLLTTPSRAQGGLSFNQLPKDVRQTIRSTQEACLEMDPENKTNADMSGVSFIDLDGSGGTDIIVSHRYVCRWPVKGAGCSTGGCSFEIWKQTGDRKWGKVLEETEIANPWIAESDGKLQAIGLSTLQYSGRCDGRNGDGPKKVCNYILTRKNNKWEWIDLERGLQPQRGR